MTISSKYDRPKCDSCARLGDGLISSGSEILCRRLRYFHLHSLMILTKHVSGNLGSQSQTTQMNFCKLGEGSCNARTHILGCNSIDYSFQKGNHSHFHQDCDFHHLENPSFCIVLLAHFPRSCIDLGRSNSGSCNC